jgi:hypothetical protein
MLFAIIACDSICDLITSDYNVWFHDGRSTGKTCYEKCYLSDFNNSDLLTCDGKKAVLVIYTQKLLEHHTTA